MFVRAKRIGFRRYVYLVEGVREKERVRQRTLGYLGPLSKLASGVPDDIRKKIAERIQVDWDRIGEEIRRIPLTWEEVSETRRRQYAVSIRTRQAGLRSQGGLPRAKGELSVLTKLSAKRFREMFEEIGEREYRMR